LLGCRLLRLSSRLFGASIALGFACVFRLRLLRLALSTSQYKAQPVFTFCDYLTWFFFAFASPTFFVPSNAPPIELCSIGSLVIYKVNACLLLRSKSRYIGLRDINRKEKHPRLFKLAPVIIKNPD
jgi:hypothetical protein